jgi:hypothetical protein
MTLLNTSSVSSGCVFAIIGNVALLLASLIIVFADLRNLQQKTS